MKIFKKVCIPTHIYAPAHSHTYALSLSLVLSLSSSLSHAHTPTRTAFFAKELTTTSEVCTSCIGIVGMHLWMFVSWLVCMPFILYLSLCVCIHICVCINVRWYIGTHSFAYISLYSVCMCVYMHARSVLVACMHARIWFSFFPCMWRCMWACMYV